METLQIIILSLVQGLTEFLPISSSAHLILVPHATGWDDQGLVFDVALHVGTLLAVVAYFRTELAQMAVSFFAALLGRGWNSDAKLALMVGVGTIPVGLVGLFFNDWIELYLRSPLVIASATIGFGILLWVADRVGRKVSDEYEIGWFTVAMVGLFQALALIPGTSRSGITLTAGLLMGMTRKAAARFSFLLSIPVILLAGGVETIDLVQFHQAQQTPVNWNELLLGAGLSAVSAYLCIHFFLKLLDQVGVLPFVLYRLGLGIFLFVLYAV